MPSKTGLGSHQEFASSDKATLVVLCGWLSAHEKHLNKYVELWHRQDTDVLRVNTRWMDLLTPQLTMGRAAPKVAAALNDIRSNYANIIFHVMSSGGYFYASVVDTIMRDESLATLKPHLKGLIADSLSDWPWILSNKRALSETLSPAVISMLPTKKIDEILSNKQDCPPMLRTSPANLEYFIYRNKIIQQNPLKLPGRTRVRIVNRI